jgi:hypothetical protein
MSSARDPGDSIAGWGDEEDDLAELLGTVNAAAAAATAAALPPAHRQSPGGSSIKALLRLC